MAKIDFGVPSELEGDALDERIKEAKAKGAELNKLKDEEITDEQLDEFTAVSEFLKAAGEEIANREQAAEERSNRIAELRNAVAEPEEEAPAEEEETPPAAEEEAVEEEALEPQAVAASTEDGASEVSESVTATVKDEEEKDGPKPPVAEKPVPAPAPEDVQVIVDKAPSEEDEDEKKKEFSVGTKPTLADGAKHSKEDAAPPVAPSSAFSLTAAANVDGVTAGTEFASLKDAHKVILKSMKALPTSGKGVYTKSPALVFSKESEFTQTPGSNDTEMLMQVANEHRLEGNSLVAAGGWAAPSEQLLDFCNIEKAEGLVDLPSMNINRGGVNLTKGPTFEDVLGSATGFWDMTEAVAEAGTELKTSLRPAVPTFNEVRLEAVGVMMEAGLLTRAGWPELVERYAKLAMLAHQVKVHQKLISKVQGYTGAAVPVANGYGNALDILHIIDVLVTGERQRYSMSMTETLEVWIPYWVKTVIRVDLANRTGVDMLNVADAQIASWFAARGARVQWLNHWQPIDLSGGFATQLPETVEIIAYPAGTFVKGEEDVLTLNTVYDSTNLKKNDYVHLFVEQGILVANPCFDGRRASFPLNANGRTAANDLIKNFGRAPAPTGP